MENENAVSISKLMQNTEAHSRIDAVQDPIKRYNSSTSMDIYVLDEGNNESIENLALCCKSGPARLR